MKFREFKDLIHRLYGEDVEVVRRDGAIFVFVPFDRIFAFVEDEKKLRELTNEKVHFVSQI